MHFSTKSLSSLLVLSLAASRVDARASARFYSHETVGEQGKPVDFQEIKAGLAHAWGVASSFVSQVKAGILNDPEVQAIAGHFYSHPKSHLALVVTGVEQNFASPEPHYTWEQGLETSEQLANLVGGLADDFAKSNPDSMVVVSTPEYLSPQNMDDNVVQISTDSKGVHSLEDAFVQNDVEAKFKKYFGSKADIFDAKDSIERGFMTEMVNAYELLSKVGEDAKDSHPDAYAIVLSGVEEIANHHDTFSTQYRHAQDIAEQVVEKLMNDFKELYGENGAVEILTTPPAALIRAAMVRRFLTERATKPAYGENGLSTDPAIAKLQLCAPDAPTCAAVLGNCSQHGKCVQAKKMLGTTLPPAPTNRGNVSTCYVCDCTVKCYTLPSGQCDPRYPRQTMVWAGDQCQYQDVSTSANLIFWTSFLLIMILIFSIWFLFKASPEPFAAMSGGTSVVREKAE